MTLSLKDLQVLAAIRRLGKDAYAAQIVRDLKERSALGDGGPWTATTFYRVEKRLSKEKLVRSIWSGPGQRGGRSRRIFTLTGAGNRKLDMTTALLWHEPEKMDG